MSQENVEVVRAIYAEWERGNMAAALPYLDPHVTFETFMPDSQENVVVHGLDGLAAFMREWLSNWSEYRAIADEIRPVGTDNVFVGGRQAGVGGHSGAEVESPGYTVWTFRGGRVVRLLAHYERDAALEAVGLRE